MKTIVCKKDDISQGPLILVNQSHPLRNVSFPLIPLDLQGRTGLSGKEEIYMERHAANLLHACIHSIGGEREIVPVSGWRSHKEQEEIWNSSLETDGEEFTKKYVALPDCSEHQTGLAIDLGHATRKIDFIRPAFPYDSICGKFRQEAVKYGFVERYGQGKETITGIAHEPWHFRYVGSPHAKILKENGLCLEEYVPFLKTGPKNCVIEAGRMAQVFYVPCPGEETEIELPNCCGSVQISGDNISGFIVTVWGEPL